MWQIKDYRTFIDNGKAEYDAKSGRLVNPPPGYSYTKVHLVFDVKHDGRHKARLVCDSKFGKKTLNLHIFCSKWPFCPI
jgi:hypothetical protein